MVKALLVLLIGMNAFANPRLINGKPVDPADKRFIPVVRIKTGNSGCTATVVGKRVAVTAAHCGQTGATSEFSFEKTVYTGKVERSDIYPGRDHDLSVIVFDKDWEAELATVSIVKPNVGETVTLAGYGCTNPGGGGGNDGVLRYGDTAIISYTGFDAVSRKSNGAALCYGDSGGPSFHEVDGKFRQWGVNSKGNISDTNYNAGFWHPESVAFLQAMETKHNVEICGMSVDCDVAPSESFTMKNAQGELKFTRDPGSGHDIDYIKNYAQMFMNFLETGVMKDPHGNVIPLPHPLP